MKKFVMNKFDSDQTLEKYIKKTLKNAPLSFIYKLFRKKDIKVNGKRETEKYILNENDEVLIYITDEQANEFISEKEIKPSDEVCKLIVYEDDDVIIINKPRDLLVQKDDSNSKSLDDMVKSYMLFKGCNNSFLAAPVHRIDRNTSGLVIFAKSIKVANYFMSVFQNHKLIGKTYFALVKGKTDQKGEINAPLIKNERMNKVFVSKVEEGGKPAFTSYETLFSNDEVSYVKVNLLTGRSHQIRVHMAYINHPLVGDAKYGDFEFNKTFKNKYNFNNQFLHAGEITFGRLDPILEKLSNKTFKVDLPEDEREIINKIKRKEG